MKSLRSPGTVAGFFKVAVVLAGICAAPLALYAQDSPPAVAPATRPPADAQKFDSPQQAVDALVSAVSKEDAAAIGKIFGAEGKSIISTGEAARDRENVKKFAAEAATKTSVSMDPKNGNRAFLLIGQQNWPFPIPIVKSGGSWSFDANEGREELLYRRIGANELDAIALCHGFVDAQRAFALRKRDGYAVAQYAQHVIAPVGTQNGLAWKNPDGTWSGVVGDKIAHAIAQGYTNKSMPYHGYYFKILTGQGPAAPLGEMDYIVKGVMIGGFGLVAAPAKYGVTGVKTFIVSNEGTVYEKDLGPNTLDQFQKMRRYNPDKSWTPVSEEGE
jgi:hypothetical protein